MRTQRRHGDEEREIKPDQQQAGQERAGEQVAHRHDIGRELALRELRRLIGVVELVAEQHQHGRGRNDLRQRRGGRHRAGGKPRIVAVPQHGRQHDQADGDGGRADHAGAGREQRADDDDGKAEAAAQAAEQPAHALEQLLGDLRLLQHHAHEDEHRDGEQHIVGHNAENALR